MREAYDLREFSEIDPSVPIRNFRRVTPWLWRGGQPGAEGIESLAQLGARTVISLRRGKIAMNAEREKVESVGMKFVNSGLAYWLLPKAEVITSFIEMLDDETNHPIFLHCLHGKDRTGLMVAIFRIARQGWTFDKAYTEMKLCGFHRFSVRSFKWVLWNFARKHGSRI